MGKPDEEKGRFASPPDQTEEAEPVLEWTCHPVKRKPLVSVLVTLFILAVVAVVFYTTASRAFGVLAAVVMLASLAKFYFPTTYRLTNERITIKTTTQTLHKDWSTYRSCYPDKNGILLSPFVRPSRLENFRGIYLMFNNNHDEITSFVKAHINRKTESRPQDESGEA
jgi:hypothetical protein